MSIVAACIVLFVYGGHAAYADGTTDDYLEKLKELLSAQDTRFYFETMTLSPNSKWIDLDGRQLEMDVAVEVKNCRAMLPIRPILEAMGATLDYEACTRTVHIVSHYGERIDCKIGAKEYTINGEKRTLEAPSYIKHGRTYLPLSSVSEMMSLEAEFDPASNSIIAKAPYQTARILVLADESLDSAEWNATTVLYDGYGMWVMQFGTPAESRQTIDQLQQKGIHAEPDLWKLLDY